MSAITDGPARKGNLELGTNRWLRQSSDLPAAERQLLGQVLQHFITRGAAPGAVALTTMAAAAGVALGPALSRLADRDLPLPAADGQTVLGAYPFSAVPTAHRVAIADRATVFAVCAVDALGIAFLAGRSTTITSCDAATGEPLRIAVDVHTGLAATGQPNLVVFSPSAAYEGRAAACICPVIAFFGSAERAVAFGAAHPEFAGRILSLAEAVTAGRHIFADPGDFFWALPQSR